MSFPQYPYLSHDILMKKTAEIAHRINGQLHGYGWPLNETAIDREMGVAEDAPSSHHPRDSCPVNISNRHGNRGVANIHPGEKSWAFPINKRNSEPGIEIQETGPDYLIYYDPYMNHPDAPSSHSPGDKPHAGTGDDHHPQVLPEIKNIAPGIFLVRSRPTGQPGGVKDPVRNRADYPRGVTVCPHTRTIHSGNASFPNPGFDGAPLFVDKASLETHGIVHSWQYGNPGRSSSGYPLRRFGDTLEVPAYSPASPTFHSRSPASPTFSPTSPPCAFSPANPTPAFPGSPTPAFSPMSTTSPTFHLASSASPAFSPASPPHAFSPVNLTRPTYSPMGLAYNPASPLYSLTSPSNPAHRLASPQGPNHHLTDPLIPAYGLGYPPSYGHTGSTGTAPVDWNVDLPQRGGPAAHKFENPLYSMGEPHPPVQWSPPFVNPGFPHQSAHPNTRPYPLGDLPYLSVFGSPHIGTQQVPPQSADRTMDPFPGIQEPQRSRLGLPPFGTSHEPYWNQFIREPLPSVPPEETLRPQAANVTNTPPSHDSPRPQDADPKAATSGTVTTVRDFAEKRPLSIDEMRRKIREPDFWRSRMETSRNIDPSIGDKTLSPSSYEAFLKGNTISAPSTSQNTATIDDVPKNTPNVPRTHKEDLSLKICGSHSDAVDNGLKDPNVHPTYPSFSPEVQGEGLAKLGDGEEDLLDGEGYEDIVGEWNVL